MSTKQSRQLKILAHHTSAGVPLLLNVEGRYPQKEYGPRPLISEFRDPNEVFEALR